METFQLRSTLYMLDLLALWEEHNGGVRLIALSLRNTVDTLGRSDWGAIHSTLWNNAISTLNSLKQYSEHTQLIDDIIASVYELRDR